MSDTINKRFYIGGLSNSVAEDELSERFSRFEKVSNLSLKSRQDEEGNCIKVFAHLNIEGSEENIKKCFNTYQNTKWKGSVLKLQYAKESFLDKLQKERDAEANDMMETSSADDKKTNGEWKAPEFTKVTGPAVPGTPIPGKKDWVVGKYGRVLPVLNVKKSYKVKAIKHDPSKFCHAARVFKDENIETDASTEKLTWEINKPDSELTKKRKGEISPSPKTKKAKTMNAMDFLKSIEKAKRRSSSEKISRINNDFEVVRIGEGKIVRDMAPSRFDSDYDTDDNDTENNKVSTPLNSNRNMTSKEDLQKDSHDELQNVPVKSSKKLVSSLDDKMLERNSAVSLSSPKQADSCQAAIKKESVSTPESGVSGDGKRKVAEFKGLGMLMNMPANQPSPKTSEGIKESNVTKSKIENSKSSPSKGKSSMKDPLAITDSSHKSIKTSKSQSASINDTPTGKTAKSPEPTQAKAQTTPELSPAKAKKPKKKSKSDKSISSDISVSRDGKLSAQNIFGSSISILKDDGNESASSADTDEIIARCKNRDKISTLREEKNNNLLNQSVDLSEFSAAAPEIYGNATSTPYLSQAASPSASDSYDSDLDSNDFELVAKKLAAKANNSQLIGKNKIQKKEIATETSQEASKKSAKKETPIKRKEEIASDTSQEASKKSTKKEAPTPVRSKEEIATETSQEASKKSAKKETPTSVKSKEEIATESSKDEPKKSAKRETPTQVKRKENLNDNKEKPASAKKREPLSSKAPTFLQSKLLGIASSNVKQTRTPDKPEKPQEKNADKHALDNEKRLKALDEQKRMKEEQKKIVKTALENVDKAGANTRRIVFDSSSDEDDDDQGRNSTNENDATTDMKQKKNRTTEESKKSSPKLKLLDSSSSDESDGSDVEEMFKSKPQFEGKKGEKLMAMQRRIGDSRFKLDEKFMESEDSDDEEEKDERGQDDSFADEKKMNLEILENVVGKSNMDQFTAKQKKKTKHIVDMNAVRFDPTKIRVESQTTGQGEESSDTDEEEEEEMETDQPSPPAKLTRPEKGKEMKEDDSKKKNIKEKEQTKSSVIMSSSLINMLKDQAKEEKCGAADDAPTFSLLQQFDEGNEGEEISHDKEDDEDLNEGKEEDDEESASSNDGEEEKNEESDDDDEGDKDDEESSDDEDEESSNSEEMENKSDTSPQAGFLEKTEESMEVDEDGSSDNESEEEGSAQSSDSGSESSSGEEPKKEEKAKQEDTIDSQQRQKKEQISSKELRRKNEIVTSKDKTHVTTSVMENPDSDSEEDESSTLKSITSTHDPQEEKEKTLLNAGRTDIRFTKESWLERWDEIRTDLMKLCRRKHKDAGKRKRLMNEKKRKKDILKSVKRKPWLKR